MKCPIYDNKNIFPYLHLKILRTPNQFKVLRRKAPEHDQVLGSGSTAAVRLTGVFALVSLQGALQQVGRRAEAAQEAAVVVVLPLMALQSLPGAQPFATGVTLEWKLVLQKQRSGQISTDYRQTVTLFVHYSKS